jgi:NTE family protein
MKDDTSLAAAGGGRTAPERRKVVLALQGGGAHGAFTWGVCDRLLEDGRLEIEGICGTSAGAMNAAVLGYGFALDGAGGARAALDHFWQRIAESGRHGPIKRSPMDRMMGNWKLDYSPSYFFFDMMTRMFSPYQFNPTNQNPLRDVLLDSIDFDVLRASTAIRLFICATNVRSGKVKVFENRDLKVEALLASACLPFLFQTVEIDGESYWDGGYMGNPALFPLIYNCQSRDVLIVQINPLYRDEVPTTSREILERVNEISFNSSLMREMRAVQFVTSLIDSGQLDHQRYRRMNFHMIASDELSQLGASTKLNADLDFLEHMRDIGRRAADGWLTENFDSIGVTSTIDLIKTFF